MAFTVISMKGDQEFASPPFNLSTIARRHAEDMLPARRNEGVSGVNVVTDDGRVVFSKDA